MHDEDALLHQEWEEQHSAWLDYANAEYLLFCEDEGIMPTDEGLSDFIEILIDAHIDRQEMLAGL
jgi:hypothetical protein